jgi:hypothetical protein
MGILLVIRRPCDFVKKQRFFPRTDVTICNEKQRREIGDFAILSLARLPISPPWLPVSRGKVPAVKKIPLPRVLEICRTSE